MLATDLLLRRMLFKELAVPATVKTNGTPSLRKFATGELSEGQKRHATGVHVSQVHTWCHASDVGLVDGRPTVGTGSRPRLGLVLPRVERAHVVHVSLPHDQALALHANGAALVAGNLRVLNDMQDVAGCASAALRRVCTGTQAHHPPLASGGGRRVLRNREYVGESMCCCQIPAASSTCIGAPSAPVMSPAAPCPCK